MNFYGAYKARLYGRYVEIIDADAFYQQEWVHCGMYEPMVGVENIKVGRETLKMGYWSN